MAYESSNQLIEKNKDLQIKQREADISKRSFQAGMQNALMMIGARQKPGQSPGDDKTGDNRHDKDWPPPAPLKPKLAHTPHTPESTYDDYGSPEEVPRYKGGNPGGQLIEIPWMKEEYKKKHPKLEQLHKDKYHKDLKISGLSEFDTYMQNMRRGSQNPKSGSIKHHPPHIQKLILGIGKRIRA